MVFYMNLFHYAYMKAWSLMYVRSLVTYLIFTDILNYDVIQT
jgi:hypothetical protein